MAELITRAELIKKIHAAEKKVAILGVVSIDLDWQDFVDEFAKKLSQGNFVLHIFRESENSIYSKSLIAQKKEVSRDSTGRSFSTLKYAFDAVIDELRFELYDRCVRNGTDETKKYYKKNFFVRTMCLEVPVPVVQIDDKYYITMSLVRFSSDNRVYQEIDSNSPWYDEYEAYFSAYLDNPECSIKYSGVARHRDEGKNDEILELYDNDRVARGLYPRDCFYNTINAQLVVWAFIFNRKGQLLLHRRKWNAKDNQGLWDKSVGGHIDYLVDFDSTDAVSRELIEELFSKEEVAQTHTHKSYFSENPENLIFLGDWRPDIRVNVPFNEINRNRNEWLYFRLPKSTSVQRKSDRIMPPSFFDKDGTPIPLPDLKDALDKHALLSLAKKSIKYKHQFAGNTDAEIYKQIEPTDILELLDEERIVTKKKSLNDVAKKLFNITVTEGDRKRLNVISDIYLFVADSSLSSEEQLKQLENSDYMLLDLEDIKDKFYSGELRLSPDMETTLANTDGLMSILDNFATRIKRSVK